MGRKRRENHGTQDTKSCKIINLKMERKEEDAGTSEVEGEVDDYPRALVQFLRRDGLGALQQRYAITATHHKRYPNLVCLKYNQVFPCHQLPTILQFRPLPTLWSVGGVQIRSPMTSRIVQECRGVIVDVDDDWRVVAYPYRYCSTALRPTRCLTLTHHQFLLQQVLQLWRTRTRSDRLEHCQGSILSLSIGLDPVHSR